MVRTIYLKLGGSFLTDKQGTPKIRKGNLKRACEEISEACRTQDLRLIIGHGGGAHAHQPAVEHRVHKGKKESTRLGVKETYRGLGEIHNAVLTMLMKYDLPVISFPPRAWNVLKEDEPESFFAGIVHALNEGFIPVVFGDVLLHKTQGWVIRPTEWMFERIFSEVPPDLCVLVSDVDGVYGSFPIVKGQDPIDVFTEEDYVRVFLGRKRDDDATGGMAAKVRWCLDQAVEGVPSWITTGVKKGRVLGALRGKPVSGTFFPAKK